LAERVLLALIPTWDQTKPSRKKANPRHKGLSLSKLVKSLEKTVQRQTVWRKTTQKRGEVVKIQVELLIAK
jgi:hypothetical protein